MNILNIVRNEFIKLTSSKKFIILIFLIVSVCILSGYGYIQMRNDVINQTAKGLGFDQNVKSTLMNLNYAKFSILFSSDFIYKPFLPIYLIFMSILLGSLVSEDYLEGTMKFSLISPVSKQDLILGKILFIFIFSTLIAIFNLIISLVVGYILFGASNVNIYDVYNGIYIYLISVLPIMAFSTIVIYISLIIKNTATVITISVIMSIIITIVDYFTKTKEFSPIGILSIFSDGYSINIEAATFPLLCSVLYIIVFIFMILSKIKSNDILY